MRRRSKHNFASVDYGIKKKFLLKKTSPFFDGKNREKKFSVSADRPSFVTIKYLQSTWTKKSEAKDFTSFVFCITIASLNEDVCQIVF